MDSTYWIFGVLTAIGLGILAHKKQRSVIAWVLFGFFIPWLAIIVAVGRLITGGWDKASQTNATGLQKFVYFTTWYCLIVLPIGILIAISIPGFASYRMKSYNTSAREDLENLRAALKDFHRDFGNYPNRILGSSGNVQLSTGDHKRTFKVSQRVFIILKSKNDEYAAITAHKNGNTLYGISSHSDKTYKLEYSREDLDGTEDRLLKLMNKHCKPPGDEIWGGWSELSHRSGIDVFLFRLFLVGNFATAAILFPFVIVLSVFSRRQRIAESIIQRITESTIH